MDFEEIITIRNCIFAFKCDMKWEKLSETDSRNIKFCNDCQKEVHFCRTDEELVEAVKRNKCIGIVKPFTCELMLGQIEIQKDKPIDNFFGTIIDKPPSPINILLNETQ